MASDLIMDGGYQPQAVQPGAHPRLCHAAARSAPSQTPAQNRETRGVPLRGRRDHLHASAGAHGERLRGAMGWHGPRRVPAECLECLLIMGRGQLEQVLRAYVQQSSTTTGTVRTGRWACKRRTQPLS